LFPVFFYGCFLNNILQPHRRFACLILLQAFLQHVGQLFVRSGQLVVLIHGILVDDNPPALAALGAAGAFVFQYVIGYQVVFGHVNPPMCVDFRDRDLFSLQEAKFRLFL